MNIKTLILVALTGSLVRASFFVTPDLIKEAKIKAKTWKPYDYSIHPFKG